MRVHDVDFSLSVSLQRKPKDGAHAIMLHGHVIAGFTPTDVDKAWFFTGMFVPPLGLEGKNIPISSGVCNPLWRRSCIWFFCPQAASNDIKRLLKACEKHDPNTRVQTAFLKNVPLKQLTESSFKLSEKKKPPSLFNDDTLSAIEMHFLDCCTAVLPRTLFHLSFWCVVFSCGNVFQLEA